MSTFKKFLFLFLFLIGAIKTFAQNDDCELTLSRANEEFNSGHFYIIPSILSTCLNQFTSEQKQRAYLLLTQTYLLLDDPIGARQSYLNVLQANPEFQTDTALHPIDVIYLSKKFTATPIFSWFAKAGANGSIIRKIYDLNAFGDPLANERYKIGIGYQAIIGGDFNLNERISTRLELAYSYNSFKNQSTNYWTKDAKVVTEKQSWISSPLTLVYSKPFGKYRPYGYLGYSFQYLIGDRMNIKITNNKPTTNKEGERDDSSVESPTLNSKFKRNKINQSFIIGGGLKIKVGLDFLFVDLRYSMGMKNVAARNGTYLNNTVSDQTSNQFVQSAEISMRYAEVGDYFRLDNLSLSVGFLRPLYKPRELKRARTKSVLRKIKNG